MLKTGVFECLKYSGGFTEVVPTGAELTFITLLVIYKSRDYSICECSPNKTTLFGIFVKKCGWVKCLLKVHLLFLVHFTDVLQSAFGAFFMVMALTMLC